MKIDRQTIKRLERLSRIELQPAEIETVAGQLERMVEFVATLRDADTTGAERTGLVDHGTGESLRDDAARDGLTREVVAEIAPDFEAGFFRVPRVLEKEEG